MTTTAVRVTLRSTPRTVHLVREPGLRYPDKTVRTWCGVLGFPYEPTLSAWRQCRRCQRAEKEHGK